MRKAVVAVRILGGRELDLAMERMCVCVSVCTFCGTIGFSGIQVAETAIFISVL